MGLPVHQTLVRRDPEQGAEGVEGPEAPVEAEGELIEMGLQVLRAAAVMGTAEPGLQVAEDAVDDGKELFGHCRVAVLDDRPVSVAAHGEVGMAGPIVGDDRGARPCTCPAQFRATGVLWWTPRPSPRVRPPTRVSSTSTGDPCSRSRSGRTIPARRLGRIPKAVSERDSPNGRWNCGADRPLVWLATRGVPRNPGRSTSGRAAKR